MMKPPPKNWPRMSSAIYYEEPAKAIDWLCKAFGFEIQLKVEGEDGSIAHSELVFGGGLVMVGDANRGERWSYWRSPKAIGGGNTQSIMVYVDDLEAHLGRARSAGAKIVSEPETHDYGEGYWADRSYECEDLEGHHWWFAQRLKG